MIASTALRSRAIGGTQYDLAEENLLAEKHIKYGGFGGIAYHHVSDMYILLFSHFVACGTWEAIYILDILMRNQSTIKPTTIHSDTQGQNLPVFGLAYLLGIELMPRIRNWKGLRFYLVFDTFVKRAQLPLQYVFADHWLVDAWIVDEETRSKASRLWLTLLVDAYSRAIVGMALLSEGPCIESIQTALQHAIWPKTSHVACGVKGEWSVYGIPQQLFLDNAWAHHSHSLENLARTIAQGGRYNSIDLVFRPPYRGRYGAIIERLFRNFSGQLQELVAGAIHGNTAKQARSSAKDACLLYSDLERILHQLILTYQHTPHRELQGRTPHQVWSEGVVSSGLPLIPQRSEALERSFMRLYPDVRRVTSRGIAAFGLHYWDASLGGIARRDSTGKSVLYQFRYTPTDLSRIALYHDGIWVGDASARELQQADGSLRQVSLAEWTQAKRLVKENDPAALGSTASELVLMTELSELHERRRTEKRALRKRKPRLSNEVCEADPPAVLDEATERVLRFLY